MHLSARTESTAEVLVATTAEECAQVQKDGMLQKGICSLPGRKQGLCVHMWVAVGVEEDVTHILCQEIISSFFWSNKTQFFFSCSSETFEPSVLV